MTLERGFAATAAVYQCSWIPGGWLWSASGPGGFLTGGADTEDEAWDKARLAREQLKEPLRPKGSG